VSGSGIIWAICKSAPHPKQITMAALHHSVAGWKWTVGNVTNALTDLLGEKSGAESVLALDCVYTNTPPELWQF